MENVRRKQFTFSSLWILAALLILWAIQGVMVTQPRPRPVPYSEFLTELRADRVAEVSLRDTEIVATLKDKPDGPKGQAIVATRLPGIDESPLLDELQKRGVRFSGTIEQVAWWQQFLLGWFLPIGLMVGLYFWAMRRVGKRSGPLSVGKNRSKIYDANKAERITFDDVAGVDEAEHELIEVVDFLKNPDKYRSLGARIPKGVLLVGPPGTGKTLLAKAVAGEAAVPFFSISASEFVEMFVGVGAARMRDLFEQAKERAPCIVFIDELDAIGKSRGGLGALATNDEREQTLNQLLVEMDGFDGGSSVIIMAATNRPEILDHALLRAGRFDRQVLVDRPDLGGRKAILEVHVRKLKLAPSIDLRVIAQRTPGMVGADLANAVNEAALAAARRGSQEVEPRDFEEAIDRIQLGLKKRGHVMNDAEKRRVAYHEGGHTVVAVSVENADPVHRVTIIPRSIGALGATLQLPTEDRYLMTRAEMLDRVAVMMGGRAAEEIVLGDTSTGAQNDLERATEMARQMVCRFGMSERMGPQTFGRGAQSRFLELPPGLLGEERNFSEETARAIDAEVRNLLEAQYARARQILEARRPLLEEIGFRLLKDETLERTDLELLVKAQEEREHGNGKPQAAPADLH